MTLLVSIGYSLLFWVNYDGATPGKKLLGIRIIKENGEKLNYAVAIIRYIGFWVSSLPLFLGYFWMLWDKKGQTWHDKLTGTVVVKTDKKINTPLVVLTVLLGFIFLTGFYTLIISREFQKVASQKGRQDKFIDANNRYAEDINKLDTETQELLKSALAKVQQANELAKKLDLTDSDKEQIQILLAASIKEAKQVADTNSVNPAVWFQLGNIYSVLIKDVSGADTWAIYSYQKAISLDPSNYLYHEKLGGVYSVTEKYEQAIEEFRKITEISPFYANGYYNLGISYKKYGAKSRAKEALEKALELLSTTDPDRYKVEKELDTL